MISMLIKMIALVVGHVLLTLFLQRYYKGKELTWFSKIFLGVIYGICAVMSTHFGVRYEGMIINVRDMGPLCAGLYFNPVSGIIAGLIGGIERYIAGTYFGIGAYTTIACSVSTCLAGFVSAFMTVFIFNRKKPSAFFGFFMGAVMEVFHMYVVLVTHRSDLNMAYHVVKKCSIPMIIFTGIGIASCSVVLLINDGEWRNPFKKRPEREISIATKFQFWLFASTIVILLVNFCFSYKIQTSAAIQDNRDDFVAIAYDIRETYEQLQDYGSNIKILRFHVGRQGSFDIIQEEGYIIAGDHMGKSLDPDELEEMIEGVNKDYYESDLFESEVFCYSEKLNDTEYLLLTRPTTEVYYDRNAAAFELLFADILLLTVIFVMISLLVQAIVVSDLNKVNDSLHEITEGHLDEEVSVYDSSEFSSLSDDINQTVDVLKGYIAAAEKRINQELEFARQIQASALPRKFQFPRTDFEIFATMDPAKEVGGDFYDFFLIDHYRMALVIADVSGKGIPASLFMMRSMGAIRSTTGPVISPAEILERVNKTLCEGNDADMFVTVWIGIINLTTGRML